MRLSTSPPLFYVDIIKTALIKRPAVITHVSQHSQHWYPRHERVERFRQVEAATDRAESFVVARHLMT